MDIIKQIEENYLQLSRQERKVATTVTQDPQAVQQMTISAFAKAAGVSNSTITRFVRQLSCKNFYDFKLQLARLAADPVITPKANTDNEIEDQVYAWYQKIIQGTWQVIDAKTLKTITQLIHCARRVYIYGLGSSGYTAQEFAQRLLRMDITAFAMTDIHMLYINSDLVSADDIIIAISSSGNSQEVNEAVRLAKQRGTRIIGITGFIKSPLSDLCDERIIVKSSTFVDDTRFFNTQLAINFVLDCLTKRLTADQHYRKQLNQTVNQILDRKSKY